MEFDFNPDLFDDLSFGNITTSSDNSFLNDPSRWVFSDIHNHCKPPPCAYRCHCHCQCQNNNSNQSTSKSSKKRKSPAKKSSCTDKTTPANKKAKTKTKKPTKQKPAADVDTDTEVEDHSLLESDGDEGTTARRQNAPPARSPEQLQPQSEQEPQEEWNYRDSCVGTKILRYFPVNGEMTEYVGQVIAYGPPSSPGAGDQLFKVKYPEDSDVEDLDQTEYDCARHLMMATYASK